MAKQSYIPPVIPVLDLMIGQVVLAQGGNRDQYLPVNTKLCRSPRPLDVAKAMFQQTGCDWIYLADIDSFSGANPAWNVYNELLEAGFGLWIDANWFTSDRHLEIKDRLSGHDRLRVIVSSETMTTVEQFSVFDQLIKQELTPVFSLDKKADSIIAGGSELNKLSPVELIGLAWGQGVRDLIVLDLSLVGTLQVGGPAAQATTMKLISQVVETYPQARIVSGGGVAQSQDVQPWLDAGCEHVLVASAIHQCRITPDDIAELVPHSAAKLAHRPR